MTKIILVKDDITQQKVDAIVNAANKTLLGGGGVDGAIHRAAGPQLLKECKTLSGCQTGKAKITKGYHLPTKYVIHTVGPIYGRENGQEPKLLANCYTNSLLLAKNHGIKTVAFPSISTGVYGYPKEKAAMVAIKAIKDFIDKNDWFNEIRFVVFSDENYKIYKRFLKTTKLTSMF